MPKAPGSNARTVFLATLLVSLAIKLALSALIPMTGDEAYFLVWAKNLALGYYDHPPMVGWINAILTAALGDGEWVSRLQATLTFPIIALLSVRLLIRHGQERARAYWAGTTILLATLPFLYVITTTDTPLVLFGFISVYFFLEALRTSRMRDFVWSGVFLGLAFLSKYFAVFLGFAYFAYVGLLDRKRWKGLALLLACVLPFAAVHVYFNYTHSWMTVLFNSQSRLRAQSASWKGPLTFLAMQVYLATPVLLYFLVSRLARVREALRSRPIVRAAFFLFACPMAVFFVNSFRVKVGFHWTLSFWPIFYLFCGWVLPLETLKKATVGLAAVLVVHLAALAAVPFIPVSRFEGRPFYRGLILHLHADVIVEKLRPFHEQGIPVATTGYTPSSVLAYHAGFPLMVFHSDSTYGRTFDLIDDFRSLDGGELAVFTHHAGQIDDISRYFEGFRTVTFRIEGVEFHIVHGRGFQYDRYRPFLDRIENRYYTPPEWLPSRRPENLLR